MNPNDKFINPAPATPQAVDITTLGQNTVTSNMVTTPTPTAPIKEPAPIDTQAQNDLWAQQDAQAKQQGQIASYLQGDVTNQINQVDALGNLLGTRGAATDALGQTVGLEDKRKVFNDTSAQYNSLIAEQNALNADARNTEVATMKDAVGRQSTTGYNAALSGNLFVNQQKQKDLAVRKLAIAADLEVARGNFNTAKDYVDAKINAQFEGIQAELSAKQQNINNIMPLLNKAETKQAQALQNQYNIQLQKIEDQKQNQKDIAALWAEAGKNGAPKSVLDKINQTPDKKEAFALAAAYMRDPNDILQGSLIREQILTQQANRSATNMETMIKRANAGDPAAMKYLGIAPTGAGTIRLDPKEAQSVSKDVTNDDNYKAIGKALDAWRSLKVYEDTLNKNGVVKAIGAPNKAAMADSAYTTALLNNKEYFNLGVLNGPDLPLMKTMLPPNSVLLGNPFVDETAVAKNAATQLKKQFGDKLDNDILTVTTRFANYDKDQVPVLRDVQRKYIQTKAEMDPKVASFIQNNPNLSPEEVIQVINPKLQ